MFIKTLLRRFLSQYWITSNTIRYRIELRVILKLLDQIPASRLKGTLVDLGAGSGEMSRQVYRKGFWEKYIGVEPDPKNHSILKDNWRNTPSSVILNDSLLNLSIPCQSTNLVISTQVLEHISDHNKAAEEISRIMEDKSYAIISVPHPPEIFPNPGHVRPGYTYEQLVELFQPHQLTPICHEYFFTIQTLRRLTAIEEFPFLKCFLTLNSIDAESNMSSEEIKQNQPYGITVLFQKIA